MTATMTKDEREDLQRLVRQREKVMKSAAKQRSAELLADFDNQLGAEYSFDDDEVWAEAQKLAEAAVARANADIARRWAELRIPRDFAPGLNLTWRHRGYGNLVKERREELRRMAITRIAAIEAEAIVKIEVASVEAQTALALAGLTSEAAREFLAKLPSVESLMPALSFRELVGEADPPIAEQLISPNALRQRRHREKRKALRNAAVTSSEPGVTSPETAPAGERSTDEDHEPA